MRMTLALALTLFVACKKSNEAKPTEGSSAKDDPKPAAKVAPETKPATPTPTPSTSEVKPAADCPPGAWKNDAKDQPRFCIVLPKDYALKDKPENKSHHEWRYTFTGPGDYRPELSVVVQGIAKPGVASGMSAYGPNEDEKKVVTEDLPNGKRVVSRPADYDKEEYAMETEVVVLSKGETVDVSKECGSCPPWEWIVRCYSSTAKQASAADRNACKSLRMP
jgi:hypothetical protein